MRQALALVVMVSFGVTSSTLAAGPFEESARRAAEEVGKEVAHELAHQTTTQASSNGRALTWGGVALMGAGVALIVVSNTSAKKEECIEIPFGTECVEETNSALALAGLATAGLGAVLTVVGIRKNVELRVGANSARLSVRF